MEQQQPAEPCGRRRGQAPFRGFTLLELLTVISIISMLMGLLLPALGSAKQRSMAAKCGSNQHQIGLAITQFAGDYFDLLPREGISPWVDRPRLGAHIPWIEATRPYLLSGGKVDDLASPVYLDPAHPNPNHVVHYVINGIGFEQSGSRILELGDRRGATPSTVFHRPSDTIYLTEFTDDRDNSIARNVMVWNLKNAAGVYDVWNYAHIWGPDVGSNSYAGNVRRVGLDRHGRFNNVLFADMHVGTMNREQIQDRKNWFDGTPLAKP